MSHHLRIAAIVLAAIAAAAMVAALTVLTLEEFDKPDNVGKAVTLMVVYESSRASACIAGALATVCYAASLAASRAETNRRPKA